MNLNKLIEEPHLPGSPDLADELAGLHRAIQLGFKSLPASARTAFAKNALANLEKDARTNAEKWLSISLGDAGAKREYQAALGEAYAEWKANTSFMERVRSQFVSPLPHTLPLILWSFRSLATSRNIDTWNILVKHKTFFSSREFRQLEFSR